MRVLVLGASGFIGSRAVVSLLSRGNTVICAGRNPKALHRRFPSCPALGADLLVDDVASWLARLAGIDAVVNAAGLFRGDLDGVHYRGAVALFNACAEVGVSKVLQISALGAGVQPGSRFLTTKYHADAHLLRLAREVGAREWCVLRPSLVIGRGGTSTAWFSAMAAAPVSITMAAEICRIQPIHVEDLAHAVADLIEAPAVPPQLDLVGPAEMTMPQLTDVLRAWLGLAPVRSVAPPLAVLRIIARVGDVLPSASLTSESLQMLLAGNTADVAPMTSTLGWMPRPIQDALATEPSVQADVWQARLLPLRWLLRSALLAVWVWSGLASFLIAPNRADPLLAGLGLTGRPAFAAISAGATLDVALGLMLLRKKWRRPALVAQLAVMAVYTALASVSLPAMWLDPFGPLLKNFAVLAVTLALVAIEE